jgi:hypothetical protein
MKKIIIFVPIDKLTTTRYLPFVSVMFMRVEEKGNAIESRLLFDMLCVLNSYFAVSVF